MVLTALIIAVARQIFDESIICLRSEDRCNETIGPFKDDDIIEPPIPNYPSDELDDEPEIWEA